VTTVRRLVPPALLVIALAAPAQAEPRLASKGPYSEASIGAAGFIGASGEYSRPGPAFGVRAGLDLFSWFSIGAVLAMEVHEANVPPPPEGEYFQIYQGGADGRLSIPVGRFNIFGDGGAGLAMVSTNVLAKVDVLDPGERFSPVFSAGGGLEYQLGNRHYAAGTAVQWQLLPAFAATQSLGARLYLRYTY
jgi:opacity protein-like surface antigen